jgi:hypothetical protein
VAAAKNYSGYRPNKQGVQVTPTDEVMRHADASAAAIKLVRHWQMVAVLLACC